MRKSAALLLLALLAGTAQALWAHGGGVLRVDHSSMPAGDSVRVDGSHFTPGTTYRLKLAGSLQEFPLPSVRADAKGQFVVTIAIPGTAREGTYRLQAIAPDGDNVAALDLTVQGSAPVPGAASTMPMHPTSGMGGMAMPMGGEAPIVRQQGGVAWAVIGGVIGLAAGLGLGLLVRRKVGLEPA